MFGNAGNLRYEITATDPLPNMAMDIGRAAEKMGWRPAYDLRAGLTAMRDRIAGG